MLKDIHGIMDLDGAYSGIRDTDKEEGRQIRSVIPLTRATPSGMRENHRRERDGGSVPSVRHLAMYFWQGWRVSQVCDL